MSILGTYNGHGFAFSRAFVRRPAWYCSRCKLQKLKIYFITHLCSVSLICADSSDADEDLFVAPDDAKLHVGGSFN